MAAEEHVRFDPEVPELRSPILVCAFAGWNDGAGSATSAVAAIAAALDAEPVASLDPEDFYDFQVNRPQISLADGQTRQVDWPANIFFAAHAPGAERDLVLLTGIEPNNRWRTFAEAILFAAERFEVEMMVSLGALIADVAHTRPVPITGLASDDALVERLNLSRSSYEGPTGIVGVLHDSCRQRGIVSASLWAAIPHYVATVPNPKAALALLRRLEGFTGIAIEASELEDSAGQFEDQINRAVEGNAEITELVRQLEEAQEDVDPDVGEVPSGDTLAREFQRFLRQRGTDA